MADRSVGPLYVKWSYLPKALPWLIKFLRAGSQHRIDAISAALAAVNMPTFDAYAPLLRAAGRIFLGLGPDEADRFSSDVIGEGPPYVRISDRHAPHDLYLDVAGLWPKADAGHKDPPPPLFSYGSLPSSATPASAVLRVGSSEGATAPPGISGRGGAGGGSAGAPRGDARRGVPCRRCAEGT